jgi:hypothetical protein
MLFESVSIAFVQNKFEENRKSQCQKHITRDLTRPGQRPGEFVSTKHFGDTIHQLRTFVCDPEIDCRHMRPRHIMNKLRLRHSMNQLSAYVASPLLIASKYTMQIVYLRAPTEAFPKALCTLSRILVSPTNNLFIKAVGP